MKVIVLGAGITGVASAWFLRQAGHEVTVIERRPGPAQETSFANGSQISVSHSEPWSNPSAPRKVLQWLGEEDAPLLYRFHGNVRQWKWGLRFLLECLPRRTARNTRQCLALADFSQRTLRELRQTVDVKYDYLMRGIMHFYTDLQDFNASKAGATLMTSLGCLRQSIDADEVVRIEPALSPIRDKLVGGDFTPGDEHGDARQFSIALAERAKAEGVHFLFNTSATRLLTEGTGTAARIAAVETILPTGDFVAQSADAFVISMGSFSAPFLKPLGIDLMIYPTKGYSATYPVIAPDRVPSVSLIDSAYKLVFSRLGNTLRVAGTAEISDYHRQLDTARCELLTRRTRELFPDACDYSQPNYWSGMRPMTPSNVPYIGRAKYSNLYLNTGHGTLGWTMGCGSGRAIAHIVSGGQPEVAFDFMDTWPR
ncbi:MAG: D-amino acid dehydrogenase [Burkholderiaceae bacterium]|nr:D-amino acid dehydrogenase [Burkholderiaceae bacterium]